MVETIFALLTADAESIVKTIAILDEMARIRTALDNLVGHSEWGRVWLICRNSTPVSYAVLRLGYRLEYLGRDAFVDEIYIRESDRGQGVGRATFEFLKEVCRSLNVNALHQDWRCGHVCQKLARSVLERIDFV